LICCSVSSDFGAESESYDAGYAGTEFDDCGAGREEGVGEEEVCGRGEPGGEEGCDFPDNYMGLVRLR
jgi:hypothetical protein